MTSLNIFCVLTPPRSGSSLTAGVLNILGVYLGEQESLAEGSVHNPKGYWEHKAILEINNEILSRLDCDYSGGGANWKCPPVFPDGWEKDRQLDDLKEHATAIIQKDLGRHEVWGWKDPRTCFTLPFWQEIMPSLQYIICVRNPVDVARSQQRFLNCAFERGLYLWLLYLKYAFQNTDGQNRIFIQTEAWTDNWSNELSRLARFIGRPELVNDKRVLKEVRGLVDKNLWHHGTSSKALSTVLGIYEDIVGVSQFEGVGRGLPFQKTLDQLAPEAMQGDEHKKQQDQFRWQEQLGLASTELAQFIPEGSHLILVDDNQIGPDFITGRSVIPFLERDGHYWGRPSDDREAVKEFMRVQKNGATYIVFAWPAHWWLECFPVFSDYLRSTYHCVLQNERLVVFDLQA